MKLTTKLIGSITVGAALLVGIVSVANYNLTRTALNDEIAVQQLSLAQQTMDKIDRLLYERFNGVNVIAENATIIQYISGDSNAHGRLVNVPLLVQRTIAKLESATGPWENIDIVTRTGAVLYSTNSDPTYKSIARNPAAAPFLASAAQGRIVYSDVFISSVTHNPTMLFMAPIRDETRSSRPVVGVAAAYLSWPVVLEILQSANTYDTTLLNHQALEIGDSSTQRAANILVTSHANDAGFKKAQAGNEQSLTAANDHGTQTLTSYAIEKGFLDYQGNGWVLAIETPTSVAFAPAIRTATTISVALTVAMLGISALLIVLVFRSLRPLALISKTTQDIAGGDLSKRVPLKSKDEVGQLAIAFNAMADKLETSYSELEQQIAHRTAQLARQAQDLKKFQLAVENASDQVVMTDQSGSIIYANPQLERQTGWTVAEVLDKKPWNLWSRQERYDYQRLLDSARIKKQALSIEMANQTRAKNVYYVRSSISPIFDDQGHAVFFVIIEHDITRDKEEKARIESLVRERTLELSREHARLQSSLSSLKIGFLMTDTKDNIIFLNQAARRALGDPSNTSTVSGLQRALKDAGTDFDVQKWLDDAHKLRRNKTLKEIPIGDKFYHVLASPIISSSSREKNIGTVLLLEDVSEEQALQRSRDEFFSIASHELRTPLTAIRGNSALLRDFFFKELKSPEGREIVSDIHQSSMRLIDIVNDFLDMSRLEQGRISYSKANFDVEQLCRDIIKEYDVTGSREKLYLKVVPSHPKPPTVYADQNRIRQIIINLIGNALKFTDEGGITVTFTYDKQHVTVHVTDTGHGISRENQALLFRKFQQAQTNLLTRDATKGTGLGLYISRLMAREMGGEVAIERSEPGKGSTFIVSVPVAKPVHAKQSI